MLRDVWWRACCAVVERATPGHHGAPFVAILAMGWWWPGWYVWGALILFLIRIRHPAALRKLLELAASQVGNLVNLSEWATLTNISNDTVAEYCRLLEETHLIRLVRPFVDERFLDLLVGLAERHLGHDVGLSHDLVEGRGDGQVPHHGLGVAARVERAAIGADHRGRRLHRRVAGAGACAVGIATAGDHRHDQGRHPQRLRRSSVSHQCPLRCRASAVSVPPGRCYRAAATMASRVTSIWPRC